MKFTFLGTGTSQGVPVIACDCEVCQSENVKDKRLRTSAMIEVDGVNLVIDSGPDFRQQMLREKVQDVDAILFTHEHKDHLAGLDDVRAFNFKHNKDMEVFASERVQEALKREFWYVFQEFKYPGVPNVNLNLIEDAKFQVKGVEVTPINVLHYKLPVKAFRIKDLTYITDANFISEEEKEKIKGSKILIVNALRKEEHLSHFTLSEALDFIAEINPEKAYLTHISHLLGKHDDVEKELPENVFLAYDGLTFEV